jgi:excisionase family DNA binding protein
MNSHEHHVKNAEALLKEPVEPEWVSYPVAEKYCMLSHSTLWRYVSSGEIKAARVGRSVRIHLPSLREFMEGRATENSLRRAKQGNQ